MDYQGLVKSLDLPAGYTPPTELAYQDIRARAISRADLDDDVRGINASLEIIQRTRGGGWPTEAVSADFNYAYQQGFYAKLYLALQRWVSDAFPFKQAYYSNMEIPGRRSGRLSTGAG